MNSMRLRVEQHDSVQKSEVIDYKRGDWEESRALVMEVFEQAFCARNVARGDRRSADLSRSQEIEESPDNFIIYNTESCIFPQL